MAPLNVSPFAPALIMATQLLLWPVMWIGPAQVPPLPSNSANAALPPEVTVCISSRTPAGHATGPGDRAGQPYCLYVTPGDRVTLVLPGSELLPARASVPSFTIVP